MNVNIANTEICQISDSVKQDAMAAHTAPILRQSAAKPTVIISMKTSNRAIAVQMCHISIYDYFSYRRERYEKFL